MNNLPKHTIVLFFSITLSSFLLRILETGNDDAIWATAIVLIIVTTTVSLILTLHQEGN